jgi:hypothetical protein
MEKKLFRKKYIMLTKWFLIRDHFGCHNGGGEGGRCYWHVVGREQQLNTLQCTEQPHNKELSSSEYQSIKVTGTCINILYIHMYSEFLILLSKTVNIKSI